MQQNSSRTPWIVCGVILVVLVCGGLVAAAAGFGLLAYFNRATIAANRHPQAAAQGTRQPALAIPSTPQPGQQQKQPPPQPASITWEDDFSDESSGWAIGSNESSSSAYVDGEYVMSVIPTEWLSWSYMEDPVEDVVIAVDTRVISPSEDGDYGIICRYQDDANFYGLEVSEDGYYTIWKYQDDEFIELLEWTYSETIQAGQPMRIEAACDQANFRLAVNNVLLANVTDHDPLPAGSYGLIVGTFSNGYFEVAFDNFTVYEP